MKKCFVIMPFTQKLDSYYMNIIKPTVEKLDYEVVRADEIYGTNAIIDDITSEIKNSDILIADVTGKNPNVNYELGYAHALQKTVVIITQSLEDVPFDYRHKRTITYDVTAVNWQEKLHSYIKKTIQSEEKKTVIADVKNKELESIDEGIYGTLGFYDYRITLHYTERIYVFTVDTVIGQINKDTTLDELFRFVSLRLSGEKTERDFIDAISSFVPGYDVDEQQALEVKHQFVLLKLLDVKINNKGQEVISLSEKGIRVKNQLGGMR